MTDLERLELVLRRVCDKIEGTPRASELYVLRQLLGELTDENIKVAKRDESERR
jgi:hypothetical protein